jgi:hypothetical protein
VRRIGNLYWPDVENIRLRAQIAASATNQQPHHVVGQLLLSDIPTLVDEVWRLRRALERIANPENYHSGGDWDGGASSEDRETSPYVLANETLGNEI